MTLMIVRCDYVIAILFNIKLVAPVLLLLTALLLPLRSLLYHLSTARYNPPAFLQTPILSLFHLTLIVNPIQQVNLLLQVIALVPEGQHQLQVVL